MPRISERSLGDEPGEDHDQPVRRRGEQEHPEDDLGGHEQNLIPESFE